MLNFVTDMREGEMDILTPLTKEALVIKSLKGEELATIQAPLSGWTHSELIKQAALLEAKTQSGADAYLGASWVGGTEI